MFKSMRKMTKLSSCLCGLAALALLLLMFVPFWSVTVVEEEAEVVKNFSVNSAIWLNATDYDLIRLIGDKAGVEANMNPMAACCAGMLVFSVAGAFFCFKNSESGMFAIIPGIAGVIGLLTFLVNPLYRTGASNVVLAFIIVSILVIILSIATIIFELRKKKQENIGSAYSKGDSAAKIAKIKTLSTEVTNKKGSIGIAESNFNQLIAYLDDEDEDCRLAAVEMLANTSKEFAFTHMAHRIEFEKSEKVATAMRAALKSIKANIK